MTAFKVPIVLVVIIISILESGVGQLLTMQNIPLWRQVVSITLMRIAK